MIKIVAKCVVKPQEIARFIAEAQPLIEASRQERGCMCYVLYQDIHHSTTLTFIEEWEDEEAINRHHITRHFKTIVPRLKDMQIKDSEVNLYKRI